METVWNLKLRRFNIKVNQDNHSWFRSNLNDKKNARTLGHSQGLGTSVPKMQMLYPFSKGIVT